MQIGLIAMFQVPANDVGRFLAAARQELQAVREHEPGCLRFDIIVFDEAEGRGAFVEVFADENAAEKHRELMHFKEFFAAIDDIDVQWTTNRGEAIA